MDFLIAVKMIFLIVVKMIFLSVACFWLTTSTFYGHRGRDEEAQTYALWAIGAALLLLYFQGLG